MSSRRLVGSVALLAAVVAGCGEEEGVVRGAEDNAPATTAGEAVPSVVTTLAGAGVPGVTLAGAALLEELRGHRWVLVSAGDGSVGTQVPYLAGASAEGRLWSGWDGCNWTEVMGSLDGVVVRVESRMGTAMGCMPPGDRFPRDGSEIALTVDDPLRFTVVDPSGMMPRLVYQRLDAVGAPADADSLLGRWQASEGGVVEFHADGTATLGTCELTWTLHRGAVSLAGLDPHLVVQCSPEDPLDLEAIDLVSKLADQGPMAASTDGSELWLVGGRSVLRLTRAG